MKAGVATDVGLVRDHNEDGYLVRAPLYAVADGMGGHLGGEVASSTALEILDRSFAGRGAGELAACLRDANAAVHERQTKDPAVAGMGTTLTAVVLADDRLLIAHVGDSRAYLIRDGRLRLLTEDHTLVGEMVREGSLTEEQSRVHPRRSILTRALGTEPETEVDELSEEILPGDRVMLCSDGLTGMVGDRRIRDLLTANADPQKAADALVSEANARGGADNVTVLVIDPDGEDPEEAAPEDGASDPAATEAARRGLFHRLFGKKG